MWFLLVIAAILIQCEAQSCKGCLNVDETSFAKLLPRFKYTLVKYDIAYPYGSKHDAFLQFAEELSSVPDVIVAEVGIKDYGQKENEDLAKSHGVDPKKLPVIKLYRGSEEKVSNYAKEEVTVEELRDFIRTSSDIHFTLPGCIEELDLLAKEFVETVGKEKRMKLIARIEDGEIKTQTGKKDVIKTYQTYMQKMLDDETFAAREQKRLRKILAEGKLSDAKKSALQAKINILHSFGSTNDEIKTKTDL